jgi:glycosyltransferase involved in cell wall biosynthesis
MGRILDYHGYGIRTYLSGLLGGMAALRTPHKITVLLGRGQMLSPELRTAGIQTFEIALPVSSGTGSAAARLVWDHLSVGRACQKLGVDSLLAPAHIRPLYAPCPVVVTIHDMLYHLHPEDWSFFDQLYFRLGVNLLTTRAELIHAVSEHTRKDVIRLLNVPAERVRAVLHGVPDGFEPQTEPDGLSLREKYHLTKPFIFYAGSFHPRKNLRGALAAFERITGQVEHDFVISGVPVWNESPVRQWLNSSPAAGRVHLVGLVPRQELPVFYSQAELFIFPSLYEGFGFPVLEAMACGCPVLATSSSSLPEVAGEAALLVPPGDEAALSDGLLRLLTDPDLRQDLSEKGLQQARRFSWEATAVQILALLEEAALAWR